MATANMREPIMKKTASFMKDEATLLAVSIPKITCIKSMNIAIAGRGSGSVMIRIRAIEMIIRAS